MSCLLSDQTAGLAVRIAQYCARDCADGATCQGICADPDVSGSGVRHAFYIQAFINGMFTWYTTAYNQSLRTRTL